EADVPLAPGATVNVTAVLPATQPQVIDGYFLFAKPDPFNPAITGALHAWATNSANVHVGQASSRTDPGTSIALSTSITADAIGAAPALAVQAYASWGGPLHDSPSDADYDVKLSERRRDVMIDLLRRKGFANVAAAATGSAEGFALAKSQTQSVEGTSPPPP